MSLWLRSNRLSPRGKKLLSITLLVTLVLLYVLLGGDQQPSITANTLFKQPTAAAAVGDDVDTQYLKYLEMEQTAKDLDTEEYDCDQSFIDKYPEQSVKISSRSFRGMKGEDKYILKHFFAQKQTPGVFIELGALDGHGLSNSHVFQKELGWTGVLIEPQITNYAKLEENRRGEGVFTLHAAACLKPSLVKIAGSGGQALASDSGKSTALCEPMSTLLSRTGIDHVDFYSIDVEGAELNVVLTHDWSKVPAFAVLIEMREVSRDLEKNRVVRNALKLAGLCRFSSGVGHHNEVWVNTSYVSTAAAQ
jgi:FkbM family methyltransferase